MATKKKQKRSGRTGTFGRADADMGADKSVDPNKERANRLYDEGKSEPKRKAVQKSINNKGYAPRKPARKS